MTQVPPRLNEYAWLYDTSFRAASIEGHDGEVVAHRHVLGEPGSV